MAGFRAAVWVLAVVTALDVFSLGLAQEACPLGLAVGGGEVGAPGADAEVFQAEATAVAAALREQSMLANALTDADKALFGGSGASAARAPKPSEPAPLTMHIDYKLNYLRNSGNDAKARILRDEVMPRVAGEIARRLQVKRPAKKPMKLVHPCDSSIVESVVNDQPGRPASRGSRELAQTFCFSFMASADYCGSPEMGIMHNPDFFNEFRACNEAGVCQLVSGQGVDADFILYVTSKPTGCLSNQYVAFSSPCYMDPGDGRPLAAYINFCPEYVNQESLDMLVDTGVHEALHTLYFNEALFENYVDNDGKTLGIEQVIRWASDTQVEVVTPKAVQMAREHFDCDSMSGVPLEDQGGCPTSSSHWDSRFLMGEVMTGQTSGMTAATRSIWTAVTLGLAEDSGWYLPIYSQAQVLPFGRGKGCEFVMKDCWTLSGQGVEEFCQGSQRGCTTDRLATARCQEIPFGNKCRTMGVANGTFSDCLNPAVEPPYNFISHGAFSRCLEAEALGGQGMVDGGVCMGGTCINGDYHVAIGGATYRCPPGGFLDIAQSTQEGAVLRIGPCPESEEMCPLLSCPSDCSTHGRCLNGVCQCFLGYTGADCSNGACYTGGCGEGFECNLESGTCAAVDPNATPDPAEIGLPIPGFDGAEPRYDGPDSASVVDVTSIISADVVPVEGSAAAVGGTQDGAGIGMGSTAGTREMDGPSSDGSMARSGAAMLLLLLLLALAL